ncbi:putative Gnk2-like domain-containing protein [Helianthus anomalus]
MCTMHKITKISHVQNRHKITDSLLHSLCDNKTAPQPREFQKAAKKLLLDLQIAAPRATNYYAASTRKIAVDNATVYAIAQCNLNLSQSVCLECIKLRSRSLYDCLPSTSGLAMSNICFMRYGRTPFFRQNQKTDIASLLWDGETATLL